jgi:hypothetical protein
MSLRKAFASLAAALILGAAAFPAHGQFPGTDPVCLAGIVPGNSDATVSSAFRVVEGW